MPRPPARRYARRKPTRKYRRRNPSGKSKGPAYSSRSAAQTFPNVKYCTLTYSEDLDLVPAALGTASNTFAANSLFDPNVTGVGGQPRYFDTLCGANNTPAPYHRYLVHGCKATAYIRNVSSANFIFVSLSMYVGNASAPSTLREARERSDTIVRQISPLGSGPASVKISMYRSIAKILGVKDLLDDQDAGAEYNANPAALCYATIVAYNPDGAVASRVGINMQLTYYSMFRRLNDVLDS